MNQEDKELLLRDLCARLPYGVIVEIISYGQKTQKPWFGELSCKDLDCFLHDVAYKSIKPYLRPMSSMTEEEKNEYTSFALREYDGYLTDGMPDYTGKHYVYIDNMNMLIDWLNKHHFDYRDLIEKDLAIEAPTDMYKINNYYETIY